MKENRILETQKINSSERYAKNEVQDVLLMVYDALKDKGYNPINQLVGYIISGDPTYITSHMNARSIITRLERDELLEEIIWCYLKNEV
jgi:uncharacterized protein (UPF0297 family)